MIVTIIVLAIGTVLLIEHDRAKSSEKRVRRTKRTNTPVKRDRRYNGEFSASLNTYTALRKSHGLKEAVQYSIYA